MADRSVRLHRVLKSKPERVFRAFLDPEAVVKWLPPHGFTCKVDHINATVGGTFRISIEHVVGPTGAALLRGGYKVEIEGATNPALYPRSHRQWIFRYLRSLARTNSRLRGPR